MTKRAKRSIEELNNIEEFDNLIKINKEQETNHNLITIKDGYRCDPFRIKKGDLLFRPAKIIVLDSSTSNYNVRNQDIYKAGNSNSDWNLSSELIGTQCWSADQYTKIEKVTMTELAHKLKEEVGDCVCKIEFNKLPDANENAKLIRNGAKLIEESNVSETEKSRMFKKLFERSQVGDYRIIRGYILRSEDQQIRETDTGMIKFLDAELMAEGKYAERLVNVRNIVALTFKLTRYELK
jgi:hypothetical protein